MLSQREPLTNWSFAYKIEYNVKCLRMLAILPEAVIYLSNRKMAPIEKKLEEFITKYHKGKAYERRGNKPTPLQQKVEDNLRARINVYSARIQQALIERQRRNALAVVAVRQRQIALAAAARSQRHRQRNGSSAMEE